MVGYTSHSQIVASFELESCYWKVVPPRRTSSQFFDGSTQHERSEYMASKGFKTLEDYRKLVEGKANEKGEEYWKDHYKR